MRKKENSRETQKKRGEGENHISTAGEKEWRKKEKFLPP